MADERLHLRLDPALKDWLTDYVKKRSFKEKRRITKTMVVESLLADLRRRIEAEETKDAEQL